VGRDVRFVPKADIELTAVSEKKARYSIQGDEQRRLVGNKFELIARMVRYALLNFIKDCAEVVAFRSLERRELLVGLQFH
jgi:hypothetical protein